MTLFDVASGNQLAREQCVKQRPNIDTKIVLDEFGVELRVVSDLDRTRRGKQLTQRRQRFSKFRFPSIEVIKVDDIHAIRRGELNQTETRRVRIKIRCLSIEPDCMVGGKFSNGTPQLFGVCDELVLRVHLSNDLATTSRQNAHGA